MSTVGRQGEADLAGLWDDDPEGLIENPALRFPPGPAVSRPHIKAGHMTASDLTHPDQFLLASRGPSTHDPAIHVFQRFDLNNPRRGWPDRELLELTVQPALINDPDR